MLYCILQDDKTGSRQEENRENSKQLKKSDRNVWYNTGNRSRNELQFKKIYESSKIPIN